MDICTIIAKNYVAQARVLADSFLRHHPDGNVSVLVIDDFKGYIDPDEVPFELIGIDSIGLEEQERMAASYDVTELSTAVKPWLLRHLLERPGCEAITYLDPDILILDDLGEVEELTLRHGLILTPHFTSPLPRDGLRPSDEDILIAGAYNLGFISMRAGAESERLLDWWSERLLHDCIVDPSNGYFVDQRWIDLVPGIYPDLHLLRDPGYNLAYWNLPNRKLRSDGERYTVDGELLRFFHFSGFDPLKPRELSHHQNRIDASGSEPLARICNAYADAVLEAGYEEARTWPYSWDMLPNGLVLDRNSRRLHRQAVSESRINGSVFSRKGAEKLVAYLTEPDDEVAAGGGVSRYLGEIRRSREDLRAAFPDIGGADAMRFVDWVQANADSLDIPPVLRPQTDTTRTPNRNGGAPLASGGVNLAGYLSSELGVGEAARQVASAMSEVGIEQALLDVPVAAAEMPGKLGLIRREQMPFEVNLLCVNADMVPEFAAAADPTFFVDRYSIGMWFWEVGQFPESLHGSFDPLDEVWVATRHIADAIRPESSIPVETIRLPVTPQTPEQADRAALGMPEGYCFLFIFDHRSVIKRKNPFGLIESFTRAFDSAADVSLVIKSVGGESHPEQVTALGDAAAAYPNIHLIEQVVSPETKNAMIASCDCYASLHRSEGFGLTMAEAMYFGKPVIATGYSGNLDFMTDENSYLVSYEMRRIGDDSPPYPAQAMWAEPDLEHAAKLMRRVADDRGEAAEKGEQAAADIRHTHSPRAAGEVIESRLGAASNRSRATTSRQPDAAGQADPPPPARPAPGELVRVDPQEPIASAEASSGMAQLRHLLGFEEAPPKPGGSWLRRASKRTYLRLLRPYVAYQRRVNESTAQAVDDVRAEVARRYVAAELREQGELEDLRERIAAIDAADQRERTELEDLRERIAAIDARIEHQAELSKGELAALKAASDGVNTKLNQALAGDRARVDHLGDEQAELAAKIGAAIGDLDARLAGPEDLVEAAAVAPFMSNSPFGTEKHAALGSVLGFTEPRSGAEAGGYRGFEDIFRGSEEMISDRQRTYLDLVTGFAPVLDVGCGRGEFLDLLKEAQIEHVGIDIDPGMVARCHEKDHPDVVQADAVEHLESLSEDALGTVFSAQVIEHLGFDELERFLRGSLEVLRPGGLFIAETVNPHSARAMKTFWVDPTHQRPLFPETMLALCRLAGYSSAFIFCPNGQGDYEQDRRSEGEYAIIARAPERHASDKAA